MPMRQRSRVAASWPRHRSARLSRPRGRLSQGCMSLRRASLGGSASDAEGRDALPSRSGAAGGGVSGWPSGEALRPGATRGPHCGTAIAAARLGRRQGCMSLRLRVPEAGCPSGVRHLEGAPLMPRGEMLPFHARDRREPCVQAVLWQYAEAGAAPRAACVFRLWHASPRRISGDAAPQVASA